MDNGKHKNGQVKKKVTNREYPVQNNKDVEHQNVNLYCTRNQFPIFPFCGPNNKPHGVRGLSKHYHKSFYQELGHVTCEICCITFACTQFTSNIDKPWTQGVPPHQKQGYQPLKAFL